jgi:L-fuculose-phosphate aldolase
MEEIMIETSLASDLYTSYHRLAERRLIVGAEGNISQRTGEGMAISAAGTRVDTLQIENFVECDFDGKADGSRKPSSEWVMHAAIYQAFPEAGAIVHTHSDACVALAVQRRSLPPFHYQMARFGGDVRCTPYVMYASPELAIVAIEALKGRTACLLGNHGMICYGRTLLDATRSAEVLETLARQYILACSSGAPLLLTDDEMAAAIAKFQGYAAR